MKKLILILSVCFSVAVVSCKETDKKQESATEMHENHANEKTEMAMNTKYQCPMDCEEGKTYDAKGVCPVCAMDLKKLEKEGKHTHDDGVTHKDHDEDEDHDNHH